MSGIVNLADYKPKPIRPKSETFDHAGQKYTCRFDPNAPKDQQWVWVVDYIRVYRFMGSGPTMEAVASKARRQIHTMNKRMNAQDEYDG
jgi:hypothetical protein